MYHPSDFDHMPAPDLITAVHQAHDDMTRAKAQLILALAVFDNRGLAKKRGAPNTIVWMVRHLNIAESTAYEYLRVGAALQGHTRLAEAMLNGELSYSVVRLLITHLDEYTEAELIRLATTLTYHELKVALAGTANRPERPPHEKLTVSVDEDTGWLRLSGYFNPENGARLLAGLKMAELASLKDVADLPPEVLTDDDVLDAALEEAQDAPVEQEAELLNSPVSKPDGAPVDPRRSTGHGVPMRDNLLASFMSTINMMRCRPTNKLRTPGAQVNLIVDTNGRLLLPSQPAAQQNDLVGAALNGDLRAHLLDAVGVTVAMSKARRLVSDAQVNALMVRWFFQCAMPGCNHTRFIEFHHIRAYAAGGPTELWNLIPLCSSCHAMVTEGTVDISFARHDRSRLIFTFANGVRFVSDNRSLPMRLIDGQFNVVPEPLGLDGQSFSDEEYDTVVGVGVR